MVIGVGLKIFNDHQPPSNSDPIAAP